MNIYLLVFSAFEQNSERTSSANSSPPAAHFVPHEALHSSRLMETCTPKASVHCSLI
jgi:hypothetical protein